MPQITTKAIDRYEWQAVIRRSNLTTPCKGFAFIMASYSNPDGSDIFPGNERLAYVTSMGDSTVRRHLNTLRTKGLITRVSAANRFRGLSDEYRLTVPSRVEDLQALLVLDPDEKPYPAGVMPGLGAVENVLSRLGDVEGVTAHQ